MKYEGDACKCKAWEERSIANDAASWPSFSPRTYMNSTRTQEEKTSLPIVLRSSVCVCLYSSLAEWRTCFDPPPSIPSHPHHPSHHPSFLFLPLLLVFSSKPSPSKSDRHGPPLLQRRRATGSPTTCSQHLQQAATHNFAQPVARTSVPHEERKSVQGVAAKVKLQAVCSILLEYYYFVWWYVLCLCPRKT